MGSVSDLIPHRDKSFEVLGFDIMIDNNLNPWLIEVNTSPDLSYSTEITEVLVRGLVKDVMRIMIDGSDNIGRFIKINR